MTFMEARAKLLEIAGSAYCSLTYDKVMWEGKDFKITVALYVSRKDKPTGVHSGFCLTWEEAFLKLDQLLNPQNHIEEEPKE